jgi:hypothetical protein
MTLRKVEDTGILNRRHCMTLSGEFALEGDVDLS